ncbi:MAG: hypothetical protein IJ217_03550 [Clostridia bacterium]|nr:hypothetical protein [Clostridia bacterium]
MVKLVAVILSLMAALTGCTNDPISPVNPDNPVKQEEPTATEGISIVPTMQDEINTDAAWCATFQLVWNDMKNEVVKQDIVFSPQEKIVERLNAETFTEDMLSSEYYYKKFGLRTPALKAEIEKGIKEKFNETSKILDSFDWPNDAEDPLNPKYFFYAMLKREFTFPKVFTILKNGKFGNNQNAVKYFGINDDTEREVYNQVNVLYYNSQNDFAIVLETENNDQVIFCKNPEGKTFEEIYQNIIEKSNHYSGKYYFTSNDDLKIPYISFNERKDYSELSGKPFLLADGREGIISSAIQTIEFDLNEKGGKIKSEAGISMNVTSMAPTVEIEYRHFYVDDTFAMFLKEADKDVPYFAAKISDITKFN